MLFFQNKKQRDMFCWQLPNFRYFLSYWERIPAEQFLLEVNTTAHFSATDMNPV